jgi:hypothetical protein
MKKTLIGRTSAPRSRSGRARRGKGSLFLLLQMERQAHLLGRATDAANAEAHLGWRSLDDVGLLENA